MNDSTACRSGHGVGVPAFSKTRVRWGTTGAALACFVFIVVIADPPLRADDTPSTPAKTARAESAEEGDVLELTQNGVIALELSAGGAYKLDVKLRNLTQKPVTVKFAPGLVADAFAQNRVYAQVGGGGGGSGFGQGLGLIESPSFPLEPAGNVLASIRTVCLNYGIPEPNRKTLLMLKRVEDYTANFRVRELLPRLAEANVSTPVAQAALWHHTNGLSWQQLSRLGLSGQRGFRPEQLAAAREWAEPTSATYAGTAPITSFHSEATVRTPARQRLGWAINPDPRGAASASGLVHRVVGQLRSTYAAVDISTRNDVPAATEPSQVLVQWSLLVRAPTGRAASEKPWMLTLQRSVRATVQSAWRHDKPIHVRLNPPTEASATPEWLSQRVVAEIAARSIQVQWSKGRRALSLVNSLPVEVESIQLRDRKSEDTIALDDVTVPAKGKVDVPLDDALQQQLAKSTQWLACRFEVGE